MPQPEPTTPPRGGHGVLAAIRWACRRDLQIHLQTRAELAWVLMFFVLVPSLFPLAVSPQPELLRAIGPGVIWIAATLSMLLGVPRLFGADFADGTLEQMVLAPAPLPAIVSGKVLAHWIAHCLPVVALAPLLGLAFNLQADALALLTVVLLLGTPILTWLGAVTSALALGVRGGGALLALLLLPLTVPVLVFGAGALESQAAGLGTEPHLAALAAGLIAAWVLGPSATALAVKIAFE